MYYRPRLLNRTQREESADSEWNQSQCRGCKEEWCERNTLFSAFHELSDYESQSRKEGKRENESVPEHNR